MIKVSSTTKSTGSNQDFYKQKYSQFRTEYFPEIYLYTL
jgi:hypothetical protein